jgi:two-component system, NarL family, response regulator NreC
MLNGVGGAAATDLEDPEEGYIMRIPANPIRVVVVEAHALLRAALCALLQTDKGIRVVGDIGNGEDAAREAADALADVVLLDLPPGGNGLQSMLDLNTARPEARVLALTFNPADEQVIPVLQAGASGYLTKDCPSDELFEAIRTVADGDVYLSPSAARLLLDRYRGGINEIPDAAPSLSTREREVLIRTAEGFTAAEIGEQLSISHKTVDTYRYRVMDKLRIQHRSELVRYALRNGLLTNR